MPQIRKPLLEQGNIEDNMKKEIAIIIIYA